MEVTVEDGALRLYAMLVVTDVKGWGSTLSHYID